MSILRNMAARMRGEQRRHADPEAVPLDTTHGPNYIISKVRSMDAKPETVRGGAGYIHGSSLIGMCPRRQCLTILSGGGGSKVPRACDRLLWAIGRAVEAHIRGQFIEAVQRVGVIGEWRCKCGGLSSEGLFVRRTKCKTCQGALQKYGELTLLDHDARIAGNPDLMYLRPDNHKVRVVEIKSINKKEFDALTEPKINHVQQAMIYRRLAILNQMEVDDSISIIYGCKDYAFRGIPYHEFHVANKPEHDGALDRMWTSARLVRDFVLALKANPESSPPLPARLTLCPHPNTITAKDCDQCHACHAR